MYLKKYFYYFIDDIFCLNIFLHLIHFVKILESFILPLLIFFIIPFPFFLLLLSSGMRGRYKLSPAYCMLYHYHSQLFLNCSPDFPNSS